MLVGSSFIPIQDTYVSYAQERVDEKNIKSRNSQVMSVVSEVLNEYGLEETYNEGFFDYLSKNGITKNQYQNYIENRKKYKGSGVEKSYKIENLTYVFDQVIYTHPIVKSIYEQNKSLFKDKDLAWKNFKKGAIYDTEWLATVFEESIEYADMEKVYKYLFKKVPTTIIKKDLENKDTIKYGLYSGIIQRELTQEERDKIESGRGYELMGVSKSEYDAYKSYINLKEKITEKQISYIKETFIHENVRNKIKREIGVDIYKEFTLQERLSVYNVSLNNYNYDEDIAEKSYKLLLMNKGKIERPVEDSTNDGVTAGGSTNPVEKEENPIIIQGDTIKEYEYLDKDDSKYGIFGSEGESVELSYKNLYTPQYYYGKVNYSDLTQNVIDEKYYVVKVGDKIYFTEIRQEEKISNDTFIDIIKTVFEENSLWKVISSQKEHLLFANNKIQTIDIKEEYSLKEINKNIKDLDMKIIIMTREQAKKIKDEKKDAGGEE